MLNWILKRRNRLIAVCFDIAMIPSAWFGAYLLFYNLHNIPKQILEEASLFIIPAIFFQTAMFWFFGLYRGVWRFASIPDLMRIAKAVLAGTSGILLLFLLVKSYTEMPRVIPVLYGLLLGTGLAGARASFRWLKDYRNLFHDSQRVLVVGAGYAGEGLVRDLLRHENHLYQPIILVDDNPTKVGREIHGLRVAGLIEKIPKLVEQYKIDLILIAIPSASSAEMRRIVDYCEQTKIPFRTLPGLSDLATGRVDIKLLRNVSLEDLLGRDQVQLDWLSIGKELQSKVILVSGGGGSIGSELCWQIAHLNPKQLIIVDNTEFNLYSIDMKLKNKFPHLCFKSLLIDVTDKKGIKQLFDSYLPDVVFHAAAYKHVPLLEKQGRVAMHNNVIGTQILAETAVDYQIDKFVLISTDKAVNPTNLMGATKRVAEMICQSLHLSSKTKFMTVRFGNVLDSAGSVVPLFRQQIQEGGPLTVTHAEITRYFMSIPEASQLIVQAALLGMGGEIFVLDMGEPIKIRYLAEQMIKLAGKTLGKDIDIVYTGLRPGEKLYEELFYSNEKLKPTRFNKIMLGNANKVDAVLLKDLLHKIEKAYHACDNEVLYELLYQLVPEYKENTKAKSEELIATS